MSDADARLAALASRFDLPRPSVGALARLLDVLATDDAAPTTVRARDAALDVHLTDSLTGLRVPELRAAATIADLGAGAGFPGLALAAALPEASVALVESVGRKCAFIERAAQAAGIRNARVVCARAEAWADGLGACDVVTARALAPLAVLVEYAAPLLRLGGVHVAWKGARNAGEERDGEAAAAVVGLEPPQIVPVEPFPGAEHRHLYVYSKVMETPARFPRRPGMARKRPLSGSRRGSDNG